MTIREIAPEDAVSAAALSAELGYPVSPERMKDRIRSLTTQPDHTVFVACVSGEVVAWIDVGVVHHLQSDPRAEIGGFIVSDRQRSAGVGRQLVLRAEQWALQRNLTNVVVRSQIARERAHRFYLREGYQRTKTSAVFTKQLA